MSESDPDYTIKDPNSPATPRQIAYLKYLKQKIPWRLTKGQASSLIESAKKDGLTNDKGEWLSTRRLLHHDLYYDLDVLELYNSLYTYIRDNMKGGSQKLTEKKIITIIDLLDKTQRGWSASPNYRGIFTKKLKDLYPGCCDEKGQVRGKGTQVQEAPTPQIVTAQNVMAKNAQERSKKTQIRLVANQQTATTQNVLTKEDTPSSAWVIVVLVLIAGFIAWIIF
jgi:hypothetical protein